MTIRSNSRRDAPGRTLEIATPRSTTTMTRPTMPIVAFGLVALLVGPVGASGTDSPRVTVSNAPHEAIQPQAAVDAEGVVHLIHFEGAPSGGDLFYSRRRPAQESFNEPIRVNSVPGSAVAMGTIRGGQLAIGAGGRIHVAWNGANGARPENPNGGAPMLYTYLDEQKTAFEPQRNLMRRSSHLDGGGTVAADDAGNVYVAWHGQGPNAPEGEAGRRVWVARSTDGGATFAEDVPALDRPTGACACCGTRALVDRDGTFYMLYRTATEIVHRDTFLLTSRDQGSSFEGLRLHPWELYQCPMSTASLAESGPGVLAAWETDGQVFYARIDPDTGTPSEPIPAPGLGRDRKHPAVAGNDRGETILVWTEGTGWAKGGALAWQVFDPSGLPTADRGRIDNAIPPWSLATVVPRPDGGFEIFR